MLGRYVKSGKKMSVGVENMLWKVLREQTLNNYDPSEVRFLHLILCKMYNYTLNLLLFREAISNAGCRDDEVLSRKVPLEIWKLVHEGCSEMGVSDDMLRRERDRAALWIHFNSHPDLLMGLVGYITNRLGLSHHVEIVPNNLTDGNFLFNLGTVLPSRILMSIAYCLLFWGKQESEPWVRCFSGKIFLLYLVVAGYLKPQTSLLSVAANSGYLGPLEMLAADLMATRGVISHGEFVSPAALPRPTSEEKERPDTSGSLDYLFIFNNNILI